MLLTQTVLLSLCLSISAHRIRVGRFAGSNGGSLAFSNSTATSTAAAASSNSSVTTISRDKTSGGGNGGNGGNGDNSGSSSAALDSGNVQPASNSDGGADEEAGQSPSATDPENFINFCSGKNTTDGFQVVTGSCNGIVMGDIPASTNMISTIITNPAPGDTLQADTNFTVNLQVNNLDAGTFTNPLTTYYSAPQALNNGLVVGHTHITIQSLGNSLTTSTPPDAQTFAFFKGVNDAGDGNGGLSATVAGGLPAGAYRVCTMTSAANHQPVLMPVAQRGAQDDCTKFLVSDSGSDSSNSAQSTTDAASSSSTAAASNSGNNSNKGGGNKNSGGGKGGRGGRFSKRAFIA